MAQETTNASVAAGAELSFADIGAVAAKVHSVREVAIQHAEMLRSLVNVRYAGCARRIAVGWPKSG